MNHIMAIFAKKQNLIYLLNIFIFSLIFLFISSGIAAAIEFDVISNVKVTEMPEFLKISFENPSKAFKVIDVDVRNEANGGAIMFDFINAEMHLNRDLITVGKYGISVIQMAQIKNNPKVARATFVMDKMTDYKVYKTTNELYVNFYKTLKSDASTIDFKTANSEQRTISGSSRNIKDSSETQTIAKNYNDILTDDSIKYEFHFDNLPIEEVVKKFSQKTKLNVILKNNVSGNITAHTQGTLYNVLEGIFKFNGFKYNVNENMITIISRSNSEEMEVSLKFKELTFTEIAESISEMANINVVLDKAIPLDKKVSFFVHKMKLIDAIKLLASMYDYIVVKVDDGTYVITPKENEATYAKKIKKVFKFKNAEPKDVIALINGSDELKRIFSVKNFSIDTRTNCLLVYDTPKNIKTLEDLIVKIDEGVRQVDIEVKLVEVQRDGLSRLGVKTVSALGFADITKKLKIDNINATMEFLENQNKAKVLASPRLLVVNNRHATSLIGEQIPVPSYDYIMAPSGSAYFQTGKNSTSIYGGTNNTTTYNNTTNNNNTTINAIDYIKTQTGSSTVNDPSVVGNVAYLPVKRYSMESIGINLDILPKIHSDTEVTIDLLVEVSSLLSVTEDGQIHKSTRKTNTIVRLKDNQTAVFGGIIKQEERSETIKVPILGDIPRLGRLFSKINKENVDTEMIMLITPHITPFDMPRDDEKNDGVNEVVTNSFQN